LKIIVILNSNVENVWQQLFERIFA
jgi:hypothetical protein